MDLSSWLEMRWNCVFFVAETEVEAIMEETSAKIQKLRFTSVDKNGRKIHRFREHANRKFQFPSTENIPALVKKGTTKEANASGVELGTRQSCGTDTTIGNKTNVGGATPTDSTQGSGTVTMCRGEQRDSSSDKQ